MTRQVALLRGWLLQHPRPATVRVKCGDELHTMGIDAKTSFAAMARSIDALESDVIEAYDSAGVLIRATKPFEIDNEDDVAPEAEATAAPKNADGETARFAMFSQHIAEAYKFATGIAFERMVDLFAAVNRRSESLEKSLEATHRLLGKAYQEQVDLALENAGAEGDPIQTMASAFIAGASERAATAAAQSAAKAVGVKSNGKVPQV